MLKAILKISFRNVLAYWKQSLAAIISLTASFIAITTFSGYVSALFSFYKELDSQLQMKGHIIVEKKGASDVIGRADTWAFAMTQEQQTLLKRFLDRHEKEVQVSARFLKISGSVDSSEVANIFRGIAYETKEAAQLRGKKWAWNTYFGKPLAIGEEQAESMVVGLRMAEKLDCLPQPLPPLDKYFLEYERDQKERPMVCAGQTFQVLAMTEQAQVNAVSLNVQGAYDLGYKEFDERFVSMPLKTAQALFDTDKISYTVIKLNLEKDIPSFLKRLNEYFSEAAPDLFAQTWQEHPMGEFFQNTISLLGVMRNFVMIIIMFVVGMSVFNTFLKLVRERTKEVGMLRSLGFLPRFIRQLYICEAFMLTVFGCAIGFAASMALAWSINHSDITYDSGLFSFKKPLEIDMQMSIYLGTFLLLSLLAGIAAFIAVRGPSKANIQEILNHT